MIKEILENDFGIFFNLIAEVECGNHFDFSNQKHIQWLKRRIAVHFFRGTNFFCYYLEDGTPVGFAAVLIDKGPEGVCCFGNKAELLDIAIFPEFREKGYGSDLLVYTEEYSRQQGVYCMYMSTYAKDYRVISFYGKNGFIPVATLPDVHGPDDEGMLYMRKIL